MDAKKYAETVILAAKIYSDSYDKEAANLAEVEDQKRQDDEKAAGADYTYGLVDFSKFYRKNLMQASLEACIESGLRNMGYPIYLALAMTWNDTLDWAKEIAAGCSYN